MVLWVRGVGRVTRLIRYLWGYFNVTIGVLM